MGRAPLVLLLAAAAPAAAGLWEEVGRNTDVTACAGLRSRWVEEGRAPDLGPAASLLADARLSVPGSGLNLSVQAEAARSLDGVPRLDRRSVALFVERWDELTLLSLGVGYRDQVGAHPAAPGRSFSETAFRLSGALFAGPDETGAWNLAAEVAAAPRREELRGELRAWRSLWSRDALALDLFVVAGALRATDADGDGLGRAEDWSYANLTFSLGWTPSPGTRLGLDLATQVASEAAGRADGVVALSWTRTF